MQKMNFNYNIWPKISKTKFGINKQKMMAVLLFIFSLINYFSANAVTRTVCSSGCGYTTISAAVAAASAGDTIHINVNGTHTESLIQITKNLTFRGNGRNTTIVQGHANRQSAAGSIFYTSIGGSTTISFTLQDFTIQHGYASFTDLTGTQNSSGGAGLFAVNVGTMRFINMEISKNDLRNSSPLTNSLGAGLRISGTGSTILIDNCIFDDNNTGVGNTNNVGLNIQGGAIALANSPITITNTIFRNNTSFGAGGAIYSGSTTASYNISNCQFINNNQLEPNAPGSPGTFNSGCGGALVFTSVAGTLSNCLFQGNSSASMGGAVYLGNSPVIRNCIFTGNSSDLGGAIYRGGSNANSVMTLINCTVFGNTATTQGSGVYAGAHGSATVINLGLINTIIAGNTGGSNLYFSADYNRLVTNQNNNIGSHSAAAGSAPSFSFSHNTATNIGMSGTLASNGGSFQTFALQTGSPMINAGTNNVSGFVIPIRDARDYARTDGGIDIGAYEFNGIQDNTTAPTISYTALSNTTSTSDRTLSATITDGNGVHWYGTLQPRIYFKKGISGAWQSAAGTLATGNGQSGTWNFVLSSTAMGGVALGDQIYYFVIAQDVSTKPSIASNPSGVIATDVNTITSVPGSPNSYTIGTATAPEINILGNSVSILNNDLIPSSADHTDFGSVSVCSGTVSRTFTIENTGTALLNLSGNPKVQVSGTNASDFTITIQPAATVNAGSSVTFTVEFNPSASGTRTATLTINNDDADENPYVFGIKGTGTDPEINIKGNNISIVDGDLTTVTTDSTDFGNQTATTIRSYLIENTGNATLTITSIAITGTNAGDFTLLNNPTSVNSGSSTRLYLKFSSSSAGSKTATLKLVSNDCDEGNYDFALGGTWTVTSTCNFSSTPATSVGLHTSTQSATTPGGWTCFCNSANELLLALKLGGTGAVVPATGVQLKINSKSAQFYPFATGFVGNPNGWAGLDRTWEVSPSTQPTSSVPVRMPFAQSDIDSINVKLAQLSLSPISGPQDLSFYKVTNSSKPAHSAVAALTQADVIVYVHGINASLAKWKDTSVGSNNYLATFLVSSFSGGGGGGSTGGGTPLNRPLIKSIVKTENQKVKLEWSVTEPEQIAYFEIFRSLDGKTFNSIGTIDKHSSSNFQFYDANAKVGAINFYRIEAKSKIHTVVGQSAILNVMFQSGIGTQIQISPNPAISNLTVTFNTVQNKISAVLFSMDGKLLKEFTASNNNTINLEVNQYKSGFYLLKIKGDELYEIRKIYVQK